MNYIGGKYRLIPQIFQYFPKKIDNFVDLFAGGLDVGINVNAINIFCNDINYFLIDIYKKFQELEIDEILNYIHNTIEKRSLSKTNSEAYKEFRAYYNNTKNPLDLFILICFSFNHQFRFNSCHEFNTPFGKNRSSYNQKIEERLIEFHSKIQKIRFSSINYKNYDFSKLKEGDFIYADPPYLISCGSYNDGKRGFEGWGVNDDIKLFEILDNLDRYKINFALSNVIEHKGQINHNLSDWAKKYNIHEIDYHYNNSNYQSKNNQYQTKEVVITNF
jgi:DNA adenine methylase Dam